MSNEDDNHSKPLTECEGGKKKKKNKIKKKNEKIQKEISEAKSNIDDIFNNIKVKDKNVKINETGKIKKNNSEKKGTSSKIKKKKETYESKKNSNRLHTPDGLPIYSMEELNMGRGGYTKDCPFECSCCF
ncbi:hypothetical protein YYC_04606 [Plasmodium yoelii 17X]|uniref:DUF1764-domain-containing protein n=4 Tax=Plasmodium yoelii TaxID=5861 RepID=A0AAF0B2I4_PLAYO|nr:conserved protein, unknown function [Plasmodium yoelii]EAA16570.1 hypothetical protein [Plasmodium yoelii yoelii]ETB57791.1 hypothetical protein YYC_04606 [Plasmodium yoelii 17X]WBY57433.1 hypothetical protein Py17XNL_000900326 [Plasmodium yoelii yoelii]CDU18081.1 conserved protein, unknown function [Plasmodium yoelii]VTZ78498.1 conserved protein, unknown function [Plasmodium yoelii]|eukprot:XP_725005.1 conserved protein, unknown function [Plasmodium yoelii]